MKLKHIALAVLAATSFSAAHAGVSVTSTSAELAFFAFDAANHTKSFLLDTGATAATLINGSISYSYDLSADANWTSFVSSVGASNIQWYVQALSENGGVNTKFEYATLGAGVTLGSAGSNTLFNANVTPTINLLKAAGVTTGTSEVAAAGTADYVDELNANNYTTLSSAGVTSFTNALGTTGVSFFGVANSNTAKAASKVTLLTAPTALAGVSAAGLLTIAAPAVVPSVPEPESYGLALVGLLLAGAVARRRAA